MRTDTSMKAIEFGTRKITYNHNHSKSFYSLLTHCQPDWRKRKELLDKILI
jgi:hypothetical protein